MMTSPRVRRPAAPATLTLVRDDPGPLRLAALRSAVRAFDAARSRFRATFERYESAQEAEPDMPLETHRKWEDQTGRAAAAMGCKEQSLQGLIESFREGDPPSREDQPPENDGRAWSAVEVDGILWASMNTDNGTVLARIEMDQILRP
jgi:hypothetical protein